jgi:hypothetical protein
MPDRQNDFQLIFFIKEPDSYFFTAESNHYKPLDHVVITRDVNKVWEVSNQLPCKLNITNHSPDWLYHTVMERFQRY